MRKKFIVVLLAVLCSTLVALACDGSGPHQHSFESKYGYDANKHWIECKCGEVDPTTEQAHELTANTNATHHWQECECGYKTTEVAHELTQLRNDTHHWQECECGYKSAEVAHELTTNSTATHHWQECECGYKTAEVTHELTANTNDTHHWQECECEYKTTEVAHDLTTNSTATHHWQECECGYKSAEVAHTGGTATCTEVAQCIECGTSYGELGNHAFDEITPDVEFNCQNCQLVVKKNTAQLYALGDNATVNFTSNDFVLEDIYTVTVKDSSAQVVASTSATVAEAGKLTVDLGAVTLGQVYTVVCEKENLTIEYTNVLPVTSVINDMTDFASLFTYTEDNDYDNVGASGYYVLGGDIDASDFTLTHGKTDSTGIGLTGTFDGRGYVIDGITLANAGLFGFVKGGTIKNLGLTNVNVQSSEAYVITRQSNGMTVDNVFVSVNYSTNGTNQALFERAWGKVTASNLMVVATGGNENTFAIAGMWNNETNYTFTNVYAISALKAVRTGEFADITIYNSQASFSANVNVSELTNFNEYWDLTNVYPIFKGMQITFETDVKLYLETGTAQTALTPQDVFGEDTEYQITSITDENGVEITYSEGYVTLPSGLAVGVEYTWKVNNGKNVYAINVIIVTNVINDMDEFASLFTYTADNVYDTVGASGYYVLGGNIDASDFTLTHGKTDSTGIGLTGTFDGRGYVIDGITLTNAGLFGFVKGGTIKNLGLTNVNVQSGEVFVITKQSNGMTIDNVFVSVDYSASGTNQALFERAWGIATISNLMVVATGGNENTFAIAGMWNNETNYTFTNVYAISALKAVRTGEFANIRIYADALAFADNVNTSALNGFNSYWDLSGAYPVFKSGLQFESGNLYNGVHVYKASKTEDLLVQNGTTEYQIVQPDNAKSYEINAVNELRFFSNEQRV